MDCDERAEILEEIEETKAQLVQVNAAISAILTGSQSYTLDTGQTRSTVTRAQLGELKTMRRELKAELDALRMRLGRGRTHVVPGF